MLFGLGLMCLSDICLPAPALAASSSDLTILEFKMTGSESVVLQNTSSGVLSLKNYWLEYFNKNNPVLPGVPSNSQQLPDFALATGQTILLSGDSAPTCGASIASNLGFSLSDTSGYLRVTKVIPQTDGISLLYTPQDHVSWTSAASGADLLRVPSNTTDSLAVWYRNLSDSSWQQSDLSGGICSLPAAVSAGSGSSYVQLAQSSAAVPSTNAGAASSIPEADNGLVVPKLSEILPNPAPPQTDADDEFVELYNPNNQAFDLSGFVLQVGVTTAHKYTFPAGTSLLPQQFAAFYSSETDLSLSNTSGQVKLLDPSGSVLEQSDVYGSAKDGFAWVYEKNQWQWTTTATPGAKNIITSPPESKSSDSQNSNAKVLAAKTSSAGGNSGSSGGSPTTQVSPVHPLILAGIGSAAVLYALYEYRHDLANTLYRFRRYRAARRGVGQVTEAADVSRTTV